MARVLLLCLLLSGWAGAAGSSVGIKGVLGVWKQYVVMSDSSKVYLLTVRVVPRGNDYEMLVLDIGPWANVRKIHTFHHRYRPDAWGFDSDWGSEGTAHFDLHPEKPGSNNWQGWSSLKGVHRDRNYWVHVSN